ncbi:MAG: enoyl-CoA hydratase/isomerase family protein [Hyphomicrobiaceae bacterium]|nr:enoyl-CoA hydratase/isomerase family protein [Hyphomicrobiaceae bacterium]
MANEPLDLVDWRFTIDFEGIAWAVFDRAGESVNALGRRPLEELEHIIQWIAAQAKVNGVRGLGILSGKENCFVVGADINEFDEFDTEESVSSTINTVTEILNKIEGLEITVVCGINGACLGGGLELALACHYRVATSVDITRIGFPEVKLGIIPGFNGTARAIRQVGPVFALQNMLNGSMLSASVSRKAGYIDELVENSAQLRWRVRKAILSESKSRPVKSISFIMTKWPFRSFIANKISKEVGKKINPEHYPAPFQLIKLFKHCGGSHKALKLAETKAFAPLMLSETSRNLRRVFKLSEQLKAQAPRNIRFKPLRVHVIGAGVMGADIAGYCVAAGMQASLQDLSTDILKSGLKKQEKLFKKRFKTSSEYNAAKSRLIADPEGKYIARADIIIEAVVEKLDVKQELLATIEPSLKPGAVLCTNTSSLMIEEIAKKLQDKDRLIGIHFFNPVEKMPLVEVIRGVGSRDKDIHRGCIFVRSIGKLPLIVKSSPGFLVNRVLTPYMFAAFQRLEAGEDMMQIDQAAKVFGMPIGPIELADRVGLDVCLHVSKILNKDFNLPSLARLLANDKLGKKSGEGFYVWKDNAPITSIVNTEQSYLCQLGHELLKPLVVECIRCRDEKIVGSSDLIDAGVIFGTGFAPFRGGPLEYAKSFNKTATNYHFT